MRLIDADRLAKDLRTNALMLANSDEKDSLVKSELLNDIAEMIDCGEVIPTAYDTNNVVSQLENEIFSAELHEHGWKGQTVDNLLCLGNAIDIVKGGGVDE